MPSYYINGEEPQIVGQRCTGLYLQCFYENGQITDPVNVAYLRFEEQWYSLSFECATVFWRESGEPAVPQNSGLGSGALLNNLSDMETVIGQAVESVSYAAYESGDVQARLRFANGKALQFMYDCKSDSTQLAEQ